MSISVHLWLRSCYGFPLLGFPLLRPLRASQATAPTRSRNKPAIILSILLILSKSNVSSKESKKGGADLVPPDALLEIALLPTSFWVGHAAQVSGVSVEPCYGHAAR